MVLKILKVGVVGARVWNRPEDKLCVKKALQYLISKDLNIKISLVSGGCPKGADRFAEELAKELNLPISIHLPDKSKIKKNTKQEYAIACFERNTLIAEECDMLLAMPSYNSKGIPIGGTADTIKKTMKLNKPVVILYGIDEENENYINAIKLQE